MWLLFADGELRGYGKTGPTPPGALDLDLAPHVSAALYRACQRGRVSYAAGQLQLDGQPFTPPAADPGFTYSQAVQVIEASNLSAGLKAWMKAVTRLLLTHGEVDL